jgi:hypothetical protein
VGNTQFRGGADDWTHHRVVFSNPGTEEQAIKGGYHEKWLKIVNDPRYVMQQLRRGLPVQGPAANDAAAFEAIRMANRNIKPVGPVRNPRDPHPIPIKKFHLNSSIKQDWNESLGTSSAPTPLAYPAKWSFDTSTASCNDFVVFPTGQAGSSSQASIVAYYNLYSGGCSGTVPDVDWAYNTGGTVSLAPVFSENGNQIAFIQTSGSVASLVLLTFPPTSLATGTISSPTAETASDYYNGGLGCTAPCSYTVALSGSPNDTWSSPYYDYSTDTLFVGDSNGQLHKFSPVFDGVPAEVSSPWPVQMAFGSSPSTDDTNQLTSPVYDPNSGYVLVGSTICPIGYPGCPSSGSLPPGGGILYGVDGSTGAINGYSAQLDNGYGIRDAVLMDPVASEAYVFIELNPCGSGCHNNIVDQFPLDFTSSTTPASVIVSSPSGIGSTSYQLSGTFDNTYYTSSSGTSPTGNIYMCSTGTPATLFQIPIISGTMSTTATTGPTLGNSDSINGTYYGRCSPVTEFYNSSTSTDYVFLSVFEGYPSPCIDEPTDGCVLSYDVTNPADFSTTLLPGGVLNVSVPGFAAPTGGIIVDNAATNLPGGGESQIYFVTQNPSSSTACVSGSSQDGVCAVQASQPELR